MKLLRRLSRKSPPQPTPFRGDPVAPDQPFFAIGDLHGQAGLAEQMLARLDNDTDHRIVFVGDFVDRGDHSAQVLALLYELATQDPHRFVCLVGNHEEMMLNFLDDPEGSGPRWLRHGGLQTLASFGVRGIHQRAEPARLIAARDDLHDKMGPEVEHWLRNLPRKWVSGNVAVVHAGADPALPIDQQSDDVLTWGHPDFLRQTRRDGLWVVHGHTIMPEPMIRDGRISVDTGAYATGQLTAAKIGSGRVEFLQT